MTLNEFIVKWQGKYLEVAGSADAKFQCVDAVNGYIRDVLGLPIIEWTNAVDFPSKTGSNFDYIENTPTNIPQEGDLIVWKPSPGHIAVFIEGNVDTFKSFDQNFPIGSPCHIQNHNYINVIGWMHCNVSNESLISQNIIIQHADNWMALLERYNFSDNKDLVFAEVDKLPTLEDAVRIKDKELNEKSNMITGLADELSKMRNELAGLRIENDKINGILNEKDMQIKDIQIELEKLKNVKPLNQYSKFELIKQLIFGSR